MAGAVVGSTSGAEALYFNPAGLVESSRRGELSVNFSPTLSQFSGSNPYSQQGSISGSNRFSPVGGILASIRPMPRLGIGVGYYVSGGNAAKFENLDYSANNVEFDTLKPTVETSLAITETAIGAGYEILPGLRIGASWRMVKVSGKFSTTKVTNLTLAQINVDNISATRFNAWKLGAQYEEPHHRWGLGAAVRTSVKFNARGDTSGSYELSTAAGGTAQGTKDLGTGSAELGNTFPLQIAIGGWTRATELFRLGWEYNYTNYSVDREIAINGKVGATSLTNIPQHWRNMHVIRLGGEYTGTWLPLRFGYSYTSQVTPSDYARSTFASPGPGHSITFGTGMILSNQIDLDGALEYAFASGTGHNDSGETTSDMDFKSHAYAAHLSAKYHF
jgi:hypothetical protein